jgi:predicted Zn-dependent protease
MSESETKTDRRTFLAGSAAVIGAAVIPTAVSYARILGANDRISLAHIGIGNRGQELDWIIAQHKKDKNVEMTAVCDLWNMRRDRAVQENTKYYGRAPRAFEYLEDVLALPDVDAVVISTPEHSHSPILKLTAEADKDAYVEKPMGNVLAEAKAARDAVKQHKRIVQVGTQHRSGQSSAAVCSQADLVGAGRIPVRRSRRGSEILK